MRAAGRRAASNDVARTAAQVFGKAFRCCNGALRARSRVQGMR
ncbi:hypothetical protein A7982_13181 [Minicystis rosea]|nr:hypothetical protein A7982_13181 [Minicystis rosea]